MDQKQIFTYMKRKLILGTILLLITVGFSACEKDSTEANSERKYILGRWTVNKVDVTTMSGGVTGPVTTSTNYTSSDFIEFKDNDADELVVKLGADQTSGTFIILDNNKFNVTMGSKLLYCVTDNITETSFQFTGTTTQSGVEVRETYYLTR
jgi:hypothetical protein